MTTDAATERNPGEDAGAFTAMLDGLVSDLAAFQARMDDRMTKQDERLTMTQTMTRPMLAANETGAPHGKAIDAYVRSGDDDALRGLTFEAKGLNTQVSGDGGYLVDPQTAQTVASVLTGAGSLRSVANVVTVEATSYDVLIDRTGVAAGWQSETTGMAETAASQFERISIPLHELAAMPKASQRLLDDAAFDVGEWLAGRIADSFLRAEAASFVNGDGDMKPRGFLTYPSVANDSWSWGNLGSVKTGVAGDFRPTEPVDAIVDLIYALGARYRANATFVMNSKTAGAVRKMKDADGRFLWADTLAAGQPPHLMGYPVLISEDMPDIADQQPAIAFGDFAQGYTIAERPDLRLMRDPFSAKPHVLFYATKRIGGNVTDFAAIKVLRFAA